MIALLTGGNGSEREVSFETAKTISHALNSLNEPFKEFDLADSNWLEQVIAINPSLAVIAVHGTFGEDGALQDILEKNSIAHTGCSAEVAKNTFDKKKTKQLVQEIGITTAHEFTKDSAPTYPVVIKPNAEGSSVGISIVHNEQEFDQAVAKAEQFGEVLIEEYVAGRELTCAVTNIFGVVTALPLVEIKPTSEFFDYTSKYTVGGSEEICPALLDPQHTQQIFELSKNIFRHLEIGQYCRIDWILKNDTPYFLEVNTIPGMTKTSLINKEIAAAGIAFNDFISHLIALS